MKNYPQELEFDPAGQRSNLKLLAAVHRMLQPGGYFEIGVRWGDSLALAGDETFSLAVDPAPELRCARPKRSLILRQTSDAFFRRYSRLLRMSPWKFRMGLIDGMHLAEYVLRDFTNLESVMAAGGLIVFDDTNPASEDIARREKGDGAWTGDVWKALSILRRYRPDLQMITFDVQPAGLTLVRRLDPQNSVLRESYEELLQALSHLNFKSDFEQELKPLVKPYSAQALLDFFNDG